MDKYYYIPTHEEFVSFVKKSGWSGWMDELWTEMIRTHWLKNDGTPPKDWKTMVGARNGA